VVGKWVSAGIDLGQFVILGGDFNTVMDKAGLGKQHYMRDWIDDLGLEAPLTDILLKSVKYQTHYAGDGRNPSRIDHVFHSRSAKGITCSEVGTCDDTFLNDF
jgi:endonuclease/exonuclease/phosphatase family metal-dependent hydrolase